MMRCPDCAKFVSYGDDEIEVSCEEATYDETSETITVTCEVRIAKTCGDCGQELKEATIQIEGEIEAVSKDEVQGDLDVDSDLHAAEWSKGQGRYRETFYGVEGDLTIKDDGGNSWTYTVDVKDACEKASGFDELV